MEGKVSKGGNFKQFYDNFYHLRPSSRGLSLIWICCMLLEACDFLAHQPSVQDAIRETFHSPVDFILLKGPHSFLYPFFFAQMKKFSTVRNNVVFCLVT